MRDEKSQLKPISLFLKLITYSIYYFASTIKTKLQDSNYQVSGLIDISALFSLIISMISFINVCCHKIFLLSRKSKYLVFNVFNVYNPLLLFLSINHLSQSKKLQKTTSNI